MPTTHLHGIYRDVLLDRSGAVLWDRGWARNTIVVGCRRLLAGFMRGAPTAAAGITELRIGAGDEAWDQAGPPQPLPTVDRLEDGHPFAVPARVQPPDTRTPLRFEYLDPASGVVVSGPTQRLQIVATLKAGEPSWPDGTHVAATLREFALVAELGGAPVLVNCVRHPPILKDPLSTLERTIQLLF